MNKNDTIFVAGHRGLVGSAIVRRLRKAGFENLLLKTSRELDLRDQRQVAEFLGDTRPAFVFQAAAKVGGIHANEMYPADFIRDNLQIQTNVINESYKAGVKKLLFLGSSCIYPKFAKQPIKEEYLLTGELEQTNDAYAIAKIAGIKMCQAYRRQYGFSAISTMPTNLYGPGDNFDLETSHVVPALLRKFHDAKVAHAPSVEVWGSGTPRREFLHVDDLADGLVYLMDNYDEPEIVNIGTGVDVTIRELAETIGEVVGYTGEITYNTAMPDGTPRKLLDVSKLSALGWRAQTGLKEGLAEVYAWFCEDKDC